MPIAGSATPRGEDERRARPAPARPNARRPRVCDPGAGEPAGDRERRQHEHEMPDAVVHRRPRDHGHGDRQNGGERDGEIDRARPRRRRRDETQPRQRAEHAGAAEQQENLRQLEAEQHRNVAARHVRRLEQHAVEQLAPGLLEEMREDFDGVERIERIGHAPGPDQRHHRIGEDGARDQSEQQRGQSARPRRGCSHRRALRSRTAAPARRALRARRSPP